MKKTNTNNDDDNWLDRWAKKNRWKIMCVWYINNNRFGFIDNVWNLSMNFKKKKIHLDNIYNNDKEKSILEQILQDKLFV